MNQTENHQIPQTKCEFAQRVLLIYWITSTVLDGMDESVKSGMHAGHTMQSLVQKRNTQLLLCQPTRPIVLGHLNFVIVFDRELRSQLIDKIVMNDDAAT